MGTIFVAGTYGVGKSTLCNKLSTALKTPDFSAGDLISAVNGETYGANKVVRDKDANQNILASQVKQLLKSTPSIILAGHFCIFDINGNVDTLPSRVFYDLEIETILLLEASSSQIIKNLSMRDKKEYSESQILLLQKAEHEKAHEIATSINCNIARRDSARTKGATNIFSSIFIIKTSFILSISILPCLPRDINVAKD